MRITVLMGGTSSERDVSLATGLRVAAALRERGHQVTSVDTVRGVLSPSAESAMLAGGVVKLAPPSEAELAVMATATEATRMLPSRADTDVVFLALHGGTGEDGTIQALLDLTGVPYTGSGHLASALAMDKDLSKKLFRAAGVPTADWWMVRAQDPRRWEEGSYAEEAVAALGLPIVVKPSKQGSTVGLSLVKAPQELAAAVAEALQYDDEVMLEAFVPGRELTVGVLGDEVMPVGEIIPKHEIYDYECKYMPGMAEELFPAPLEPEVAAEAQRLAMLAFQALKLRGCARIDFRLDPAGRFSCLEANTLPGMTATSLVPQAAQAAGISFPELCERIVRLAMRSTESGG